MSLKVKRNDPCPCGSGKKYKRCCLHAAREAQVASAKRREGVQKSLGWLNKHHAPQIENWVERVWLEGLTEQERAGIATADARIRGIHDVNLLEQLIAEGTFSDIEASPLQLILETDELALDDEQRDFLTQLGHRPLRLYRVTACSPGNSFSVCDVLDGGDQITIMDAYASRMLEDGDIIGLRLLHTPQGWESSGAIYHIPEEFVDDLVAQLQQAEQHEYGWKLVRYWLRLVAAHV
ncbi:MAG: hypothetical protein D6703_00790 [Zetaproteobacteria bacterium]|nr:MAG: hypothetical protein D6703_00790 [Zetaproteobacteria bacterium]